MSFFVEFNGCKIERSFFDQNVAEAKSYQWKEGFVTKDHVHCIVCMSAIKTKGFCFCHAWLCDFCYKNFIKT
jgi:hypothetical protein